MIRIAKSFVCIGAIVFLARSQVDITGTITDSGTALPIQGAVVGLAATGGTAYSDSIGHYLLGGGTPVAEPAWEMRTEISGAYIANGKLCFGVNDEPLPVKIEAFTVSGKHILTLVDRTFSKGEYGIVLNPGLRSAQVIFLRIGIGRNISIVKAASVDSRSFSGTPPDRAPKHAGSKGTMKKTADADTLLACSVGYGVARLAIASLTGTYDIKLQRVTAPGSVQVVQTAQATDFLAAKPPLTFAADDGSALAAITVDTANKYQAIIGFGGAFTEAATYNLYKIGAQKRSQILNAYFSPFTGSGYTVCRTNLQSCDFCIAKYSYDSIPGDNNLDYFSIQHETQWMIPTIKQAMALPGADIKIFASPWSPSAWMKSNNNMLNGGTLLPASANAWALFFVKYIQAMGVNGVPIWGVTIQNEPEATQTWESCIYTAASERDFLKNNLGPTLAQNKVDVKVMIFDHNKDHVATWASTILGDTAAAKYAWGTAFHWYSGDQFQNVATTHDNFPSKHLLATEEAEGLPMGNWSTGQNYAHDIIGDLSNWAEGWVEWNLVLDQNGLPRHDPYTGCASSVYIDFNNDSVHYCPSYYYLAHFSKYLRPGAVRLSCVSTNPNLQATAFRNVNGRIVVVALNNTAAAISFKIKQGTQIVKPTIPAHAIMDFIY
jgi:glucosylceramidase